MINPKKEKFNLSILKIFLMPTLVLVLILFSFSFFVRPKVGEITQIFTSIKKDEEKRLRLTEKLSALKSLNESELTRRSALVLKALPETKKPILVISVLKQLANEFSLDLKEIAVRPGKIATESAEIQKKDGKVPSLVFSFELEGTFGQIRSLVEKLAKTLPIVRLEKVTLKKHASGGRFMISTEILSYYLYFPETLGKIDTPVEVMTGKEKEASNRLKEFVFPLSDDSLLNESLFPVTETGRVNPFI